MSRVFFIIALLAGSGLLADGTVAPLSRSDLIPKSVYWQVLPSDVRDVKIDRRGRAWFELEGSSSIDDVKRQIESSASSPAPFIRGARIMLFDSAGRIWVTPSAIVFKDHWSGFSEHYACK